MRRYNVDDFEKWDGERVVYELDSLSGGKPFVRRLFFKNDDELEMYLQGDRGYYFFPSEEIAEKFFDEFIDNADRELGIPTRKEVKDFANSNNNFKKWFGNSVVVNSDGSPKIVYHGTGREFEEFMDCGYIFLASSPGLACDYAYAFYDSLFTSIPIRTQRKFKRHINNKIDLFNEKLPKHIELKKFYDYRDGQWVKYLVNKETRKSLKVDDWTSEKSIKNFINSSKSKGGVHPLYCRIEKPYKMDAKGRSWEDIDGRGHIAEDFINMAKDNGCDGLIIDNVVDGSGHKETQYIPFSPNQVKHVYNVGTYSNNTNNFWESKSMKKQLIKLTESDLHKIIKESVKRIIKEAHGEPDSKVAIIFSDIIEDYKANEIAEEYGISEEQAAAEWFKETAGEMDFAEENMPTHREFVMDIPELNSKLYHDYGGEYYFLVKNADPSSAPMTMENTIRRAVRESLNRLIETDCAGVMQTGCGDAPKGTNPEAGQYTVPLGGDSETSDRHPGFSVDGKAKWNKKGGNTSVMRRTMYNPKSGK